MGTHWELEKNEIKILLPTQTFFFKKAMHLECMLWAFPSLGCMKFLFPKEFLTNFGLG